MMLFDRELCCAVCGKTSILTEAESASSFGSFDLDERSPAMHRYTTRYDVQECPRCGYVNQTISHIPPPGVNYAWLSKEPYRTCNGIHFKSDLSQKFYRYYLICMEEKNVGGAAIAMRDAAWMCDDENDSENAAYCRSISADLVHALSGFESNPGLFLVWCDLMRRAGRFDEMLKEAITFEIPKRKKQLKVILAFEMKLAEKKDSDCYRESDALENME